MPGDPAQDAWAFAVALGRGGFGDGTSVNGGGRHIGRRTTLEPEVHAGRIGSAPQPQARET